MSQPPQLSCFRLRAIKSAAWLFFGCFWAVSSSPIIADDGILQRKLPEFQAKNAPLDRVVAALNEVGIQTCMEWRVTERGKHYGDVNNVFAFWTNEPLLNFDLVDATVQDLIGEINRQVPELLCGKVEGAELLMIGPRKSALDFRIPATIVRGPLDQLMKRGSPLSKSLRADWVGSSFSRFVIDLDLPEMSARDFLNHMVASQPGLTWQYIPSSDGGRTNFGPHSTDSMPWKGVFLNYDVHELSTEVAARSIRSPTLWFYHSDTIEANGKWSIVVRKSKNPTLSPIPIRDQTDRNIMYQVLEMVDALITEDVDLLMQFVSPNGVKIGDEKCASDIAGDRLKAAFANRDYSRLVLSDVIVRDGFQIDQISPMSYRVSCRPTAKDENGVTYFGGTFSLVVEQAARGRWLIVEMPYLASGPVGAGNDLAKRFPLLARLTLSKEQLPPNCSILEIPQNVSDRKGLQNPTLTTEPKFFLIADERHEDLIDVKAVRAFYASAYRERDDLGIFAWAFATEDAAKKAHAALAASYANEPKRFLFWREKEYVVGLWRDSSTSDACFQEFRRFVDAQIKMHSQGAGANETGKSTKSRP